MRSWTASFIALDLPFLTALTRTWSQCCYLRFTTLIIFVVLLGQCPEAQAGLSRWFQQAAQGGAWNVRRMAGEGRWVQACSLATTKVKV